MLKLVQNALSEMRNPSESVFLPLVYWPVDIPLTLPQLRQIIM